MTSSTVPTPPYASQVTVEHIRFIVMIPIGAVLLLLHVAVFVFISTKLLRKDPIFASSFYKFYWMHSIANYGHLLMVGLGQREIGICHHLGASGNCVTRILLFFFLSASSMVKLTAARFLDITDFHTLLDFNRISFAFSVALMSFFAISP